MSKTGPKHAMFSSCKSLLWASSQSESPVDSTKVKFELGQPQLYRPGQHCPAASLPLSPLPLPGHILPSAWAPAHVRLWMCKQHGHNTMDIYKNFILYIRKYFVSYSYYGINYAGSDPRILLTNALVREGFQFVFH